MKLSRWLRRTGWLVEDRTEVSAADRSDLFAFSCVFSWKLPKLTAMVNEVKDHGEVWIGGPAVTLHPNNAKYVHLTTGIRPTIGIDDRFEREPGSYTMVYFSRGCPAYTKACGNCPVPRIEGKAFRYYPDATPAPLLLDNNLSALPDEYQDHIIKRYANDWKGKRVDANSGFEPHSFTEKTLLRWKEFPLSCWRFGYDDLSERDEALEMMALLKSHGYAGERVRVYTIVGNEPIADCFKRVQEVIDNGMHPWPQRVRPLDWLGPDGTLPVQYDWDEPTLISFQRFFSFAGLWKRNKPEDFFYQKRYPLHMLKGANQCKVNAKTANAELLCTSTAVCRGSEVMPSTDNLVQIGDGGTFGSTIPTGL